MQPKNNTAKLKHDWQAHKQAQRQKWCKQFREQVTNMTVQPLVKAAQSQRVQQQWLQQLNMENSNEHGTYMVVLYNGAYYSKLMVNQHTRWSTRWCKMNHSSFQKSGCISSVMYEHAYKHKQEKLLSSEMVIVNTNDQVEPYKWNQGTNSFWQKFFFKIRNWFPVFSTFVLAKFHFEN